MDLIRDFLMAAKNECARVDLERVATRCIGEEATQDASDDVDDSDDAEEVSTRFRIHSRRYRVINDVIKRNEKT